MPLWLQVAFGLVSVISVAATAFAGYLYWKGEARLGRFEKEIIKTIAEQLKDYVRTSTFESEIKAIKQSFDDYKAAHTTIHIQIESEQKALREFKHNTNGSLREHSVKIEDLRIDMARMEEKRIQVNHISDDVNKQ